MSAPAPPPEFPPMPARPDETPEEKEARIAASQAATRRLAEAIALFRELPEADRAAVLAAAGPAPCPDPCPPTAAEDRGAELWELSPRDAAMKAKMDAAGYAVRFPKPRPEGYVPREMPLDVELKGEPLSETIIRGRG